MTLAERVTVIEACRYVDEVIPDAPDQLTAAFLDEHKLALVVHGDDLDAGAAADVYGPAVRPAGSVWCRVSGAISTTDLLARCAAAQPERHGSTEKRKGAPLPSTSNV